MAYSYIWPASLPQAPQKGYNESVGALIIRTPTDAGPAKQRRRGRSPNNMNVSFIMTDAQILTLNDFLDNTIKSVARFGYKHPRTGQMVEVRIVPQSGGSLYTMTYLAPGFWTTSMQFEVLP